MIKNMLVIGDSHSGFLVNKNVHSDFLYEQGVHVLVYSGRPAYSFKYNFDEKNLEKAYNLIDSDWVVLPFFGEVDIRIHLVNHNNPEDLAKMYVQKTLDFFENKKCKIHFIEPVPQSDIFIDPVEYAYAYTDGLPWGRKGSIKERIIMHERFVESLRDECKKNNLDIPISLVKNITKTNELLPEESIDGAHLSKELSDKLCLYIKSHYNI